MNKIQLLNEIPNKSNFAFPRSFFAKNFTNETYHHLPTKEEIFQTIEETKIAATKYASKLGLLCEEEEEVNTKCKLAPLKIKTNVPNINKNIDVPQSNFTQRHVYTLAQLRATALKNFAANVAEEIPVSSPFVEIYNDGERRIVVKKSSLCWLLREDPGKLSSDRIERVKGIQCIRRMKKKKSQQRKRKIFKKPKILRRKIVRKKRCRKIK